MDVAKCTFDGSQPDEAADVPGCLSLSCAVIEWEIIYISGGRRTLSNRENDAWSKDGMAGSFVAFCCRSLLLSFRSALCSATRGLDGSIDHAEIRGQRRSIFSVSALTVSILAFGGCGETKIFGTRGTSWSCAFETAL